ncbi:2Fe-2S iron-sulfur cluster-binding protein [Shewanella morhuae]|uniref:2Fe-2S ferredoxin YfaE n=1 Tax=Shewanella morhuae TaxID=365591 RepID=A0A380BXM2_9GAMM|nr:2Fe-2S iron-sulfur cluster-binding protein [Shewanella morhuae]SUJ07933.1 2Fe-2S ferredoxin YfaE [Shewanella morhuae]
MFNHKQAVVYKNHTLGLLSEAFGKPAIEILYGFISKGGKHFTDSPILFVSPSEYRLATIEDFDIFGVVHNEAYLVEPLSKSVLKIEKNIELKTLTNQIKFDCKSGFCGQCKSKLISGKVKIIQSPIAMLENDEILACCCKSITPIVIQQL